MINPASQERINKINNLITLTISSETLSDYESLKGLHKSISSIIKFLLMEIRCADGYQHEFDFLKRNQGWSEFQFYDPCNFFKQEYGMRTQYGKTKTKKRTF